MSGESARKILEAIIDEDDKCTRLTDELSEHLDFLVDRLCRTTPDEE